MGVISSPSYLMQPFPMLDTLKVGVPRDENGPRWGSWRNLSMQARTLSGVNRLLSVSLMALS